MTKKILLLFPLFSALSCFTSCNGRTYKVTWVNYNGDVLRTDTVNAGETPKYTGENPTKPNDPDGIKYLFSGWDAELKPVTSDVTYTATFEQGNYKVNIVTISSELTPDKESFLFNKNDFTPVEINFTGDDIYTIDNASTRVKDACDFKYDYDNKKLTVTPKINSNFEVYVNLKEIMYTVHFHADDYCDIGGHGKGVDVVLEGVRGSKWSDIALQATSLFTFMGWSSSSSGYGDVIADDYVLTSNMDVYPSYNLNIVVEGAGIYKFHDYVLGDESITFHIEITDEEHYEFKKECKVNVTSGESAIAPDIDYDNKTMKFKSTQIEGNITVRINPYQPTYKAEAKYGEGETSYLECIFYDELYKPQKGDDFYFTIRTNNHGTQTDEYLIPDTLKMTVGGKELLDGYVIIPDPDYPKKSATVMINGKYVKGDIVVYPVAKKVENYNYSIHNYGTKEFIDSSNEQEMESSGIHSASSDFEFYIKGANGYGDEITAKNILVNIDNKNEWVSVAEEMEERHENARFTYDSDTHKFVFKTNNAKDLVDIYVRNTDENYKFLDDLGWNGIQFFLTHNIVNYLFYLGDRITVQDNVYRPDGQQQYSAKIIGFQHDDLASGEDKAQLTFELDQVISDQNGKAVKKLFINKREKARFENTEYSTYLESTFYSSLSQDLKDLIKKVKKTAYKTEENSKLYSYECNIFPLSLPEIDHNSEGVHHRKDGKTYQYYKEHSKADRIKKDLKGDKQSYWLRTVYTNTQWGDNSYVLDSYDGGYFHSLNYIEKLGYTAAFCV